jgi:hypothetical protein
MSTAVTGQRYRSRCAGWLNAGQTLVALQEVRKESVDRWLGGLAEAGLEHAVDSAKLLGSPGPPGRDYRRRYFNLISARRRSFPFWARGAGGSRSRAPGRRFS